MATFTGGHFESWNYAARVNSDNAGTGTYENLRVEYIKDWEGFPGKEYPEENLEQAGTWL